MKNNKGQALVEFIIILPIFLLLIISVIDFGNVISKKYSLENDIDVITDMYKEKKYEEINTYVNNKGLSIKYNNDNELLNVVLTKDIKIISPMVNLILGKNYKINVEKSIYKNE